MIKITLKCDKCEKEISEGGYKDIKQYISKNFIHKSKLEKFVEEIDKEISEYTIYKEAKKVNKLGQDYIYLKKFILDILKINY